MVRVPMVLVREQQMVVAVVLVELAALQDLAGVVVPEVMVVVMEAVEDVEVQEPSVLVESVAAVP